MLEPGNYVQWKSRIKRYIDTKPNNELIYYCLQNPPYKFKWTEKAVPVAEGSSETTIEGYIENYKNVSQDIRDQLNAEAEAVKIILIGIDNDIYSTVDACPNAGEMWKAIERPKQVLTSIITRMAKIQEVTLDAADIFGPIFDAEPLQKVQNNDDNYNVFAIINEHPEQPESVNDTYLKEQGNTNITIDSLDMCNNGETVYQDDDDLAKERDLLAPLIEKLKCEIDDSKNQANNELSKTNQLMFKDLKKFQAELDRYHDVNYASKINDLNQTISEMKKELFAHQETISIMSQEKEAHIKFYKTREDKYIDTVIALERNKVSFAKPEFLKKAQRANPRLYDIGCYNDNLALMLAPESDETIRLAKESRSKLSDLIRPFDYDQLNNLYDLFVPQREKSPEQQYFSKESKMSHTSAKNENSKESFNKQTTLLEKRMDESIPWDQKCKSSKELFKIKKSVDTIFDGVERCKQTIAKRTYFGHIDPFIQNTIEGNFCPQIRRINADLEKFHLCLKEEMVADLRYFNSLEHEVDSLNSQLDTQKTQFLNEIDRLSREYLLLLIT
ncbi:hypothetical protein Tco_0813856 [Tanacetum coccineum]